MTGSGRAGLLVLVALLLAGAAGVLLLYGSRHRDTQVVPVPGLPPVTLHSSALYPPHDRWQAYLAGESTCPGGERTDLSLDQQAATMGCLVNYARERRGLRPLEIVQLLNDSSVAKVNRIVDCRQFVHDACGEDPAADVRAAGYEGAWGENLYVADGRWAAPRVALDGWLNSPRHRENLFRPEWRTEGIAVVRLASFGPYRGAELWVQEFGTG